MGKLLTYTGVVKEIAEPLLRKFYETAEYAGLAFDENGCFSGLASEIKLGEFSVIGDGIFSINHKKYDILDYISTDKFECIINEPSVITVLKSKDDALCIVRMPDNETLNTKTMKTGVLVNKGPNSDCYYYFIPEEVERSSTNSYTGKILIIPKSKQGVFLFDGRYNSYSHRLLPRSVPNDFSLRLDGYFFVAPSTMLKVVSKGGDESYNKYSHYTLLNLTTGEKLFNIEYSSFNKDKGIVSCPNVYINVEQLKGFNKMVNKKLHSQVMLNKVLAKMLQFANNNNMFCKSNNPTEILKSICDFLNEYFVQNNIIDNMLSTYRLLCRDLSIDSSLYYKLTREKKVERQYGSCRITLQYNKSHFPPNGYDIFVEIFNPERKSKLTMKREGTSRLSEVYDCRFRDVVLELNVGDKTVTLNGSVDGPRYNIGGKINNFARCAIEKVNEIYPPVWLYVEYNDIDNKIESTLRLYKPPETTSFVGQLFTQCNSSFHYYYNILKMDFDVEKVITQLGSSDLITPLSISIEQNEEELLRNCVVFLNRLDSALINTDDNLSL